MKGFLSKLVALKVDVIGPKNILFVGVSVHLSARKFYRLGSEGVNKTAFNNNNDNNNNSVFSLQLLMKRNYQQWYFFLPFIESLFTQVIVD